MNTKLWFSKMYTHEPMKKLIYIFFMLSSPVIGQGLPHAKLDSLLREMHDKDQNIRREMIDASQNEDYDPFYYANKMDSIDSANQEILSGILDSVGWPENLSEKANTGIFLVIDHATKEYSEKYLELVESQADNGVIPKDLYATLYDRILMKKGKNRYMVPNLSCFPMKMEITLVTSGRWKMKIISMR